MNREDIIRMAREATDHLPDADSIRLQGIVLLALDAGEQAEREACAQVCEARFMGDLNREDMEARRCAAAIRARGDQP